MTTPNPSLSNSRAVELAIWTTTCLHAFRTNDVPHSLAAADRAAEAFAKRVSQDSAGSPPELRPLIPQSLIKGLPLLKPTDHKATALAIWTMAYVHTLPSTSALGASRAADLAEHTFWRRVEATSATDVSGNDDDAHCPDPSRATEDSGRQKKTVAPNLVN
jgi:hypothetical protein